MATVPSWMVSFHDRYGRRANWVIWSVLMLVALAFYVDKAAADRSAFVRWRHQVLQLWQGKNIYNEMMFPNPPIMPITLYPLMTLPPVVGAALWFALKVLMCAVSIVLCFRMAVPEGRSMEPWAEGLILLFSLRPILSDLHHGNINLMILFLIVTTLYAWRNGYDVLAGLLLSLAISDKVTPALFVPYFMYKGSWRTVIATFLGLGIFLLVVPSLVLGVQFNAECLAMWWHRILSPFLVNGVKSEQEVNQSMVGVLTRLLTQGEISTGRYGLHRRVNLVAWDPHVVDRLIKGLSIGLVGLLAFLSRTRTKRRDDPRMLGEFALVVLTMLFVSERSWKHHFVTLLIPFAYLVYRLSVPWLKGQARAVIAAGLVLSAVLMATTSSELGGLLMKDGHKMALDYGMFLWSAVALYAVTAWRVRVEGAVSESADERGQSPPPPPHFAATSTSSRPA